MKPEQINPALREIISFQLASNNKNDIEEKETFASALNRSIENIPQIKFIEQAQYFKNVLLPEIEKVVNYYKPSTIYTHSMGDINRDHRLTAEASLVAARPKLNSSVNK